MERTVVRSYSTQFPIDEEPLSEGGMWLNGGTDGLDWVDIMVAGGCAIGTRSRMNVAERREGQNADDGTVPEGDYDDPTAVLAGEWGPDQHAKATVFSRNPTDEYYQEVEIRLRSTMTPHSCTGYEVFFRCLKTEGGYAEIVRWNGAIGNFTSLARLMGPEFGVEDGDVIEASIVGTEIRGLVNGVERISASDDVYATGAPGIGFNFGVGDTNVDHGLRDFWVETFEG